MTFARKHPVLTIVGLGGAGLIAGAELAGGIMIGATLGVLLRRQAPGENAPTHHSLREKSRAFAARVPPVVRQRARAVVDAARGKQMAQQADQTQTGSQQRSAGQPDPDQPIESWTV